MYVYACMVCVYVCMYAHTYATSHRLKPRPTMGLHMSYPEWLDPWRGEGIAAAVVWQVKGCIVCLYFWSTEVLPYSHTPRVKSHFVFLYHELTFSVIFYEKSVEMISRSLENMQVIYTKLTKQKKFFSLKVAVKVRHLWWSPWQYTCIKSRYSKTPPHNAK